MNRTTLLSLAALLALGTLTVSPIAAQVSAVPSSMNFQGRLATPNGTPVPDGIYSIRFSLWDNLTGGTEKWNKTIANVAVKNGTFAVTLDTFPANTFNGNLWLEVKISSDTALTPRQSLVTVPYAMKSDIALTVPDGSITGAKIAPGSLTPDLFSAACSPWVTCGNTIVAGDFLGTLNNLPLVLKANNFRAMQYAYADNTSFQYRSINVLGGSSINTISAGVVGATIAGGGQDFFTGTDYPNVITADFSTIGGGGGNVGGGYAATVAGGAVNVATAQDAAVGGGRYNTANGQAATVAGGNTNTASGYISNIGGGQYNSALSNWSAIGGGYFNTASGGFAVIAGGYFNSVNGNYTAVLSGDNNVATLDSTVIAGGSQNMAMDQYVFIGGGFQNTASGTYATVAGGTNNKATNLRATVSGGWNNTAAGDRATVGGGFSNQAVLMMDTVGGGAENFASGGFCTIAGGHDSIAMNGYSTVGGGDTNQATGRTTVVAGGNFNVASGQIAAVGGGTNNVAGGILSTVPGGDSNIAGGDYSFAAGKQGQANHQGTFVWADSQGIPFASTGVNQFLIRAAGGVGINTNSPSGYALNVNGTANCTSNTWTSDRRYKQNIATFENALDAILNLRGVTFDWKREEFQEKNFADGRQIGFIAQEVEKVLPELVMTDSKGYKSVAYANVVPVLVEAVKTLKKNNDSKDAKIAELEARLERIEATLKAQK